MVPSPKHRRVGKRDTYLAANAPLSGRENSDNISGPSYSRTIRSRAGALSLRMDLTWSEESHPAAFRNVVDIFREGVKVESGSDPTPRIPSTARTVWTKSFWTVEWNFELG